MSKERTASTITPSPLDGRRDPRQVVTSVCGALRCLLPQWFVVLHQSPLLRRAWEHHTNEYTHTHTHTFNSLFLHSLPYIASPSSGNAITLFFSRLILLLLAFHLDSLPSYFLLSSSSLLLSPPPILSFSLSLPLIWARGIFTLSPVSTTHTHL